MQYEKKSVDVLGTQMSYIDEGVGDTILLLHGNPASSFIWRNIIPYLTPHARCIAPDLIGMGDSGKLPNTGPSSYRFVDHRRYLDALYEKIDIGDRVVVVGQDWGSALAFDWAYRNQARTAGIVHTESIPCAWTRDEFPIPDDGLANFLALRTNEGEAMILNSNFFVEYTMPNGTLREYSEEEMDEYRRPYLDSGEARRATLSWPREIPFEGHPADVDKIIASYADWLPDTNIPKLFIDADPGFIVTGKIRKWVRQWSNQEVVTVKAKHFVQEDAPEEVGRAIADWYSRTRKSICNSK